MLNFITQLTISTSEITNARDLKQREENVCLLFGVFLVSNLCIWSTQRENSSDIIQMLFLVFTTCCYLGFPKLLASAVFPRVLSTLITENASFLHNLNQICKVGNGFPKKYSTETNHNGRPCITCYIFNIFSLLVIFS